MSPGTSPRLTLPVGERDHIQGPESAPVTLVEYGDFECPHCARAHQVLHALRKRAGDRFRLVYRSFPLSEIHPHAAKAAEAAEAAGAQGRFWEMHDTLFARQNALGEAHLIQYAAALQLDVPSFTAALAEHRFAPKVREDFLSGVRSGVNGTPTFYVEGIRYEGTPDFDSLLAAIEEAG